MFLSILQVVEPPQTDYERSRDRNVANNIKKMQEMGLHVLASDLKKNLYNHLHQRRGKTKETRKQIVMIQIHQSISLTMMTKEVVLMMTLNYLMRSQYPWQLRCYLYLQSCGSQIIAFHLNVLKLLFTICICFQAHLFYVMPLI